MMSFVPWLALAALAATRCLPSGCCEAAMPISGSAPTCVAGCLSPASGRCMSCSVSSTTSNRCGMARTWPPSAIASTAGVRNTARLASRASRRGWAPAAAHILLSGRGIRGRSTWTSSSALCADGLRRDRGTSAPRQRHRSRTSGRCDRAVLQDAARTPRRAGARSGRPANCASVSSTATGAWTIRVPTAAGAA